MPERSIDKGLNLGTADPSKDIRVQDSSAITKRFRSALDIYFGVGPKCEVSACPVEIWTAGYNGLDLLTLSSSFRRFIAFRSWST